ncbi:SDR family oxidoreductase [Acidaminobacter sp.]|uniref:SDR family oxidoreductase n=1 Tax=Acidaminobacter sp. TaxID=1872102 RepID=UPI0013807883|nr:SDR family oxidoreductase [Acidaminobacter sp.]MDK9710156.1 SDR family oxidoreductase [Acidaminobacter sp.]MZQ98758.1 SDR family NAD(P)-dependent oxidoreductase [Acidaminobacter sp.]
MKLPLNVDLQGKVAVVTGGGGVLGGYFCEALALSGAKVAVVNRTKEKAQVVADRIVEAGGDAIAIPGDVLDTASMENVRDELHKIFGTCDILINAAGGNHPNGISSQEYFRMEDLDNSEGRTTFFDLDPKGVSYVFDLNFMGTLIPSQIFGRDMVGKKDATIINISSMAAYSPLTKVPAYSAAKAAISNFTEWLAVHFSKVGIRVNAIAPGWFITEQNRKLMLNEDGSFTPRAQKVIYKSPCERFGEPEELIGPLLFLADAKASGFINGVVIPVDGGFNAYSGV